MKTPQLIFSLLLLTLLAASCTKTDVLNQAVSSTVNGPQNVLAVTPSENDSTTWSSTANWEVAKQENYSVYYFKIKDEQVSADVANNGLVLVYKKNGNSITSLPIEEKGTGTSSQYFYHQVTEGNILITVDSYGTSTEPASGNTFTYFIITPMQLKSLQKMNYTTASLMKCSYSEIKAILTNNQ